VNVAVLGAGGIIAPAIVRDLAESPEIASLTLLDRDGNAARATAEAHGLGRATAAAVDALEREALTLALDGCQLLINAASYRVNLAAMDAALAAGVDYLDLGGLYHVSAQQYALHDAFAAAGRTAILGCGAGPGKTNVLAARAARELDEVHSVRCASAGLDEAGPSLPYALDTLRDELTEAPMALRDGVAVALEPLADGGEVAFSDPVGTRPTLYTLHSEVLTLGSSLGARDVDFRLGLMPAVETALRDPSAPPLAPASARTWSAQHVEVSGTRGGRPQTVVATALTAPHERWGIGGGIVSTGTVIAAVARLLARGELADPLLGVAPHGVFAPEQLVPFDALAAELAPRGCALTLA
jgi:saccharopine dehydrogenase-like NADP-dependent oxidoreductase